MFSIFAFNSVVAQKIWEKKILKYSFPKDNQVLDFRDLNYPGDPHNIRKLHFFHILEQIIARD